MLRNTLVLLLCSLSFAAVAEEPATLLVHGEATVSVDPDIAQLDVGLLSQAQTSQAAAEQSAARSKQFVSQMQRLSAISAVHSINLSINSSAGGYSAVNTLRVTVRDLAQLHTVMEAATQAGANSINRLTFDLRDEKAARARALAQAAGEAQSSAEALASALQLRIGKLLRVEEVQPVIISPAGEVDLSDQSAIHPASIQIHASVNLLYAVAPKQ